MSAARTQIVFYGDFNCPFCYVENERLVALGLDDAVDFRAVEHLPSLPVPWDQHDAEQAEAIGEELRRLEAKAPDVPVARPGGRPKTGPAIAAYVALRRGRPERETVFRTAVFRALWRDGKDISTPAVLLELWALVGGVISPERSDRGQARIWLTEWRTGRFDTRIPVLAVPTGERFLGLATPEQIEAFFADPGRHSQHGPDVCVSEE